MTTKPNDGGPAFPQLYDIGQMTVSKNGMSLRDYFAAQAMVAATMYETVTPEEMAHDCYRIADAMLAAREETQS